MNEAKVETLNRTYWILEDNMPRLEKKLKTIQNKCAKYGSEFHYSKGEEEIRLVVIEHDEGFAEKRYCKFIEVSVSGSVKMNGCEIRAELQHSPNGNLIKLFDFDKEIPQRYFTADSECEHCHSKRSRSKTYVLYNAEKDEWKQVGRSCLCEFTNGLDAEDVARYISLFESLIEGESANLGNSREHYLSLSKLLCVGYECTKHWGYRNAGHSKPTSVQALLFLEILEGKYDFSRGVPPMIRSAKNELDSVNFNPFTDENRSYAQDALSWIDRCEADSSYLFTLQVVCKGYLNESGDRMITERHSSMAVSLVKAYSVHLAEEERKAKQAEEAAANPSTHVGQVGDKIEFDVDSWKVVTSCDTQFGTSWLYQFIDRSGNIYNWFSSKFIESGSSISHLKGTVKSHTEFRGIKQTELTRCKIA